jgi:lysophospholipase L1-like esterase
MIQSVCRTLAVVSCLAFCTLFVVPIRAEEPAAQKTFALKDGQRVLFIGDSNTYGDMYIQYIDAYLYTRFPEWKIVVFNRGIPSETAAGTSEPTHEPPRPDVHTRFTSTVLPLKPDVVFVCYGMNDGIYRSPNAEILKKYEAGMTRLVTRVREEAHAEPIVITPPPFDYRPFASKQKPADQAEPDYRFPAEDYDKTLASFSAWLVTQREEGLKVPVIDVHAALDQLLIERRAVKDDYQLSPDGIHPSPTGHWLMAQTILAALDAPSVAAEFQLNAESKNGGTLAVKALLPLPIDPRIDAEVLTLADSQKKLGEYVLYISGLEPGAYELQVNGTLLTPLTVEKAVTIVDLNSLENFPLHAKSHEVLKLVQQRRQSLRDAWIKSEPHPRMAGERAQLLKNSTATAEQAAELDAKIRELCQPVELIFTANKK